MCEPVTVRLAFATRAQRWYRLVVILFGARLTSDCLHVGCSRGGCIVMEVTRCGVGIGTTVARVHKLRPN